MYEDREYISELENIIELQGSQIDDLEERVRELEQELFNTRLSNNPNYLEQ